MGKVIGEGYTAGGWEYRETSNVRAIFNQNGQLKTIYPLLDP
jgi:hypothetical protein